MKKILLFLILLMNFLVGTVNASNLIKGQVIGVSDGDSITLLDSENRQYKIRLQGIDAPEKTQAFGQKSKESLSNLVFEKYVHVHWSKKDQYGRTVGQVMVGSLDACLEQVKLGMAWHYKAYQSEQTLVDRVLYDVAEKTARHQRTGLWQDSSPIEPSVFRGKKQEKELH